MKQSLEAITSLIGLVWIVPSCKATGDYIKELSTSKEIKTDQNQTDIFKFLHRFSLNQSSKYLVKNLDKNEYVMYKSADALPVDTYGLRIWQKIGYQGIEIHFHHSLQI